MAPGFTLRECLAADMRRQELLTAAARERRLAPARPDRSPPRASGIRRRAWALRHAFVRLLATPLRHAA
jgi:hypothetical protein